MGEARINFGVDAAAVIKDVYCESFLILVASISLQSIRERVLQMPPIPKPIRSDCTPEFLRLVADRALTERVRQKYLLLAALQAGEIKIEDLLLDEQKTALRYIREINAVRDLQALLDPKTGGPKPTIRRDISPSALRKEASAANGKYRNGLLTFAEVVEKEDMAAGAALGLIGLDLIKRLRPLFNEFGMDGLRQLELDERDAASLREILRGETDSRERQLFEILLAVFDEKLGPAAVKKRFGIVAGTLDAHIRKFKTRGRQAFTERAERTAAGLNNEGESRRLRRYSEKAMDDVTRRNCSIVAEIFEGRLSADVARAHSVKRDTVTRMVKAFQQNGLFALFGEREFRRLTGSAARESFRAAIQTIQHPERRSLGEAAADFHDGKTFKELEDRYYIDRLALYALLWDMQEAGVDKAADAAVRHLSQLPGDTG
jgi:hypothetical protein